MSTGEDMAPLSESISDVFTRLGLPNPSLMYSINQEWETLAGTPWAGRSRPVVLRNTTLVVEASSPSMVAFLRYAESQLIEKLARRYGPGVIEAVEVLPPVRG